jgi:hypothetical protein
MPTLRQESGKLIELMGRLSLVVALVLLTAAGCSSVSICLEQEKGVSASEDARSQGCAPNRPTR